MPEGLLERETELAALREQLARARAGQGSVGLVEGAAGLGKTALLSALRDDAAGVTVVGAVGSELEQEFPFGLVRQLFEPLLRRAEPERRERLLAGAAGHAGPVLGVGAGPALPSADGAFATLHGLYWLVAALAEERPLLVVCDDVHWSDDASLRFLAFLARRVDELPVLLAVGSRPDEGAAAGDAFAELAAGPATDVLRPGRLSSDAVRALVTDALGTGATVPVVDGAADATGGNPFLLRELLRTLGAATEAVTADTVRDAAPSSITRSVQRRLRALPTEGRRLAYALAVLGDGRGSALPAAVADLATADLPAALAALRDAGLVEGDPPRFVHPLLRTAVAEGMPAAQRAALHRVAATQLRDRGGSDEELVLHVLAAPPSGDGWVVPVLRSSAARALADGAPAAAVRRLERAVDEFPAADDGREGLVLELGRAATSAGDARAVGWIAEAAGSSVPAIAASALTIQVTGQSLAATGYGQLVDRLRDLVGELGPDDRALRTALLNQLVNALITDTRLIEERRRVLEVVAADGDPALAPGLSWEAAAGDAPAAQVREDIHRALRDNPMTAAAQVEEATPTWAVMASLGVDDAEVGDAALREAEAAVRRGASRLGLALVSYVRAEWELAYGGAGQAESAARTSVEAFLETGFTEPSHGSRIALARALVRRGRLEDAEAELDALPDLTHRFGEAPAAIALGELRLAQRRWSEAVTALERLPPFVAAYGWRRLPFAEPSATLVGALALAGRREEAVALGKRELADCEARGVHGLRAAVLVGLSHAAEGAAVVEHTREAVAAAAQSPMHHVRATALVAHGSALRRDGLRREARDVLTEARTLAERIDAALVLQQATDELLLAGGRPRRRASSGVDSLTPAERRVAEHAARGLSNREIAETLFVTRKTVEHTLGRAFAKLDIKSRAQLPELLAVTDQD